MIYVHLRCLKRVQPDVFVAQFVDFQLGIFLRDLVSSPKGLRLGPSLGRQRHWSELGDTERMGFGGFLDQLKLSWEEHTISELKVPNPFPPPKCPIPIQIGSIWPYVFCCCCFSMWPQDGTPVNGEMGCRTRVLSIGLGFDFCHIYVGIHDAHMGVIWNRRLSKLPVMYSLSWFGGYSLGPRGVPLFCLSPT